MKHTYMQGTNICSFIMRECPSHLLAVCELVTNNIREFERVPGLRVEDWSAEK